MLGAKERAAVLPTAPRQQHQAQLYNPPEHLSRGNLRENLVELLLYLQKPLSQERQKRYWKLFESRLRQYVQSIPDKSGLTNSVPGVSE